MPVDPFEGGEFDIVEATQAAVGDQLGSMQPIAVSAISQFHNSAGVRACNEVWIVRPRTGRVVPP